MVVSTPCKHTRAKATGVSVEARSAPAKAMAVSDNQATRSTGPGRGARGQQRHHRLPNFARNLSWSFFETSQKRCNSNDANSMFEQAAEELRAKLMGGGGAWPGFETTRRAKLAARTARGRAAAHRHTQRPGPPAPGTPVGPQATPAAPHSHTARHLGITKPPGPNGAGRQWR